LLQNPTPFISIVVLHMIDASRRFMSASSPVPAANFVAVSLWQPLSLQQIQKVMQKISRHSRDFTFYRLQI